MSFLTCYVKCVTCTIYFHYLLLLFFQIFWGQSVEGVFEVSIGMVHIFEVASIVNHRLNCTYKLEHIQYNYYQSNCIL